MITWQELEAQSRDINYYPKSFEVYPSVPETEPKLTSELAMTLEKYCRKNYGKCWKTVDFPTFFITKYKTNLGYPLYIVDKEGLDMEFSFTIASLCDDKHIDDAKELLEVLKEINKC